MPFYTHVYHLTVDSFIGGQSYLNIDNLLQIKFAKKFADYSEKTTILQRVTITLRQPFLLQTTDDVIIMSSWWVISRVITCYPTAVENLREKNTRIKKCHVVLFKSIALIYNMWVTIIVVTRRVPQVTLVERMSYATCFSSATCFLSLCPFSFRH